MKGELNNGQTFNYDRYEVIGQHVTFYQVGVGMVGVYEVKDVKTPETLNVEVPIIGQKKEV